MNVLGIHIGHDGGSALCSNGEIVVAIAEERIVRRKHANGWWSSVRYCLEAASLSLSDLDAIVFSNSGEPLDVSFDGGLSGWGGKSSQIMIVDHHLSHAFGAFAFSGLSEAVVYVGDAGGNDGKTESVYLFSGDRYEHVRSSGSASTRFQGLGTTYEAFTNFLGFRDQESGKTMALAAYGDPSRWAQPLFEVGPGGEVKSKLSGAHQWGVKRYAQEFGLEFGNIFPSSQSRHAKDVAAYVQANFTEAVVRSVAVCRENLGVKDVVLSGGISLNCVTNSEIRKSIGRSEFYSFPAGSDTGLAIGNAIYGSWKLTGSMHRPEDRSFRFGREYSDDEIVRAIDRHPDIVPPGAIRLGEVESMRVSNPVAVAAELIGNGDVIGWWQGKSECGPRALGGRSILADPQLSSVRDQINSKVKEREWFRPFGPSVLDSDARNMFSVGIDLPYMNEAPVANRGAAANLGACVHVDGTARVQTVSSVSEDRFSYLLKEIRRRRGVGVLLNTSFNIQEPIVETPSDAVATLLRGHLDALILGDYVCRRRVPA